MGKRLLSGFCYTVVGEKTCFSRRRLDEERDRRDEEFVYVDPGAVFKASRGAG